MSIQGGYGTMGISTFTVVHSVASSGADDATECIDPSWLINGSDYDRHCTTVPRSEALSRFKKIHIDEFTPSTAAKVNDAYESWQQAYQYWNGELPLAQEKKIQGQHEVQEIRTHLAAVIAQEGAKEIADAADGSSVYHFVRDTTVSCRIHRKKFVVLLVVLVIGVIFLAIFYPKRTSQ